MKALPSWIARRVAALRLRYGWPYDPNNWVPWTRAERLGLARYVNPEAGRYLNGVNVKFTLQRSPEERRAVISAIYDALAAASIQYWKEAYTDEAQQQEIRSPTNLLDQDDRRGTCLDLALLFCGICLSYDLLPLVIIVKGHALAAVSLTHDLDRWGLRPECDKLQNNGTGVVTEENTIRGLLEEGRFIPVECTGFANAPGLAAVDSSHFPETQGRDNGYMRFSGAVEAGRAQFDVKDRPFQFAIDPAIARYEFNIRPFRLTDPWRSKFVRLKRNVKVIVAAAIAIAVLIALAILGLSSYYELPRQQADAAVNAVLSDGTRVADIAGHIDAMSPRARAWTIELLRARLSQSLNVSQNTDESQRIRVRAALSLGLLGDRGGLVSVSNCDERSYMPDARSELWWSMANAKVSSAMLLDNSDPPCARQAMILALTRYGTDAGVESSLVSELVSIYKDDDDPGVHAAAHWILARYLGEAGRAALSRAFADLRAAGASRLRGKLADKRHWFVHRQTGIVFVYIPKEQRFHMGTRDPRAKQFNNYDNSPLPSYHEVTIPRAFLLSMTEISWEQYKVFMSEPAMPPDGHKYAVEGIDWIHAAQFCNSLPVASGKQCYSVKKRGLLIKAIRSDNHLALDGYRLPTEAEWEYCCRANSSAFFSFGDSLSESNVTNFTAIKSDSVHSEIGFYAPNAFGFFDMHGGVLEWCDDTTGKLPEDSGHATPDRGNTDNSSDHRIVRGGHRAMRDPLALASHQRYTHDQWIRDYTGLRIARTISAFPPSDE